jgi:hypothetical protein
MIKLRNVSIVAFGVLALAALAAFGQAPLRAKIDFPFTAGTKVLPAGTYEFTWNDNSQTFLVTDNAKNESLVPIITRVASMMPDLDAVVFDVVGDKHILSEVWMAGEDGFVVAVTKEPHKHHIIKITK